MCYHTASVHHYDRDIQIRQKAEASRLPGDPGASEVGLVAHCLMLRRSNEHANMLLNLMVTLPATCHIARTDIYVEHFRLPSPQTAHAEVGDTKARWARFKEKIALSTVDYIFERSTDNQRFPEITCSLRTRCEGMAEATQTPLGADRYSRFQSSGPGEVRWAWW